MYNLKNKQLDGYVFVFLYLYLLNIHSEEWVSERLGYV